MNIKEAYRYLKFLDNNIASLTSYAMNVNNGVKTVVTSYKSRVNKEADDTVEDITPVRVYDASVVDITYLIVKMIDEKAKLAGVIEKMKSTMTLDWKVLGTPLSIDTGIEYAKKNRELANYLQPLLRAVPTVTKASGADFKFNVEGNQMRYSFETEVVKSLDYDKSVITTKYKSLMDSADKVSSLVEEAMLKNVDAFVPTYSIYDTLENIVNNYVSETKHP